MSAHDTRARRALALEAAAMAVRRTLGETDIGVDDELEIKVARAAVDAYKAVIVEDRDV